MSPEVYTIACGVFFGIIAAVLVLAIIVTIFKILEWILMLIGWLTRGIFGMEN